MINLKFVKRTEEFVPSCGNHQLYPHHSAAISPHLMLACGSSAALCLSAGDAGKTCVGGPGVSEVLGLACLTVGSHQKNQTGHWSGPGTTQSQVLERFPSELRLGQQFCLSAPRAPSILHKCGVQTLLTFNLSNHGSGATNHFDRTMSDLPVFTFTCAHTRFE